MGLGELRLARSGHDGDKTVTNKRVCAGVLCKPVLGDKGANGDNGREFPLLSMVE